MSMTLVHSSIPLMNHLRVKPHVKSDSLQKRLRETHNEARQTRVDKRILLIYEFGY